MPITFLRPPNAWRDLTGRGDLFQTFVPSWDFLMDYIDLNIDDHELNHTLAIYLADVNHLPVGDPLSQFNGMMYSDPRQGAPHRWRWPMTPFLLRNGVLYGIRFIPFNPYNMDMLNCEIGYRDMGNEYPPGKMMYKDDYLDEWQEMVDADITFAIFGESIIPHIPPFAPILYWTMYSIGWIDIPLGYTVVVRTNVPCHMFLYWTTHSPHKHKASINRRGDLSMRATKLCFVDWNRVEQNESYDTLYHTFTLDDWVGCVTRWIAFRAMIDDVWSQSTSPIFMKHRPLPPMYVTLHPDPHPEITCCDGSAGANGGYYGSPWPTVRDGAGQYGAATGSTSLVAVGSGRNTDKWRYIDRTYLLFDASVIPPGAEILSGKLRVYCDYKFDNISWPDWELSLVNCWPVTNTDITIPDYNNIGSALRSNDLIAWDDIPLGGWIEFELNAAGLAEVAAGGIVKLALRENSYDRHDTPPPWGRLKLMRARFQMIDGIPELPPSLRIDYQL